MSCPERLRTASIQPTAEPVVPGNRLLRRLGIERPDLDAETVRVSAVALRQLLMEFARRQPFDPDFYAEMYPDIEAARMAGAVRDLHTHYCESGFFEGRLPCEPPFDPEWYATHYPDLASVFGPDNVAGLRNHFLSAGLAEGRAGTKEHLEQPAHWVFGPAEQPAGG